MYHDDLWISAYLNLVGVDVKRLLGIRATNRGSAMTDALHLVTGELSRANITAVTNGIVRELRRKWLAQYPDFRHHARAAVAAHNTHLPQGSSSSVVASSRRVATNVAHAQVSSMPVR